MVGLGRPRFPTRSWKALGRVGAHAVMAGLLTLHAPAMVAMAADDPEPPAEPTPRAESVPLDAGSRPVRVRVPAFDIDLPVVWSGRSVSGNPAGYPLCDVAQYLVDRERGLSLPGQPGTAWLYGHAQPGMFLPLTLSYFRNGGDELTGERIELQLRDGRLLTYRIVEVESAFDYDIAERPNRRQQRLVLQTSTGTSGASPRLLVAGRLVDAEWTDEPRPEPRPRACWQEPEPTPGNTPGNATDRAGTPEPTPAPSTEDDEATDAITLALGSGAILLGATIVAVYIIRRP